MPNTPGNPRSKDPKGDSPRETKSDKKAPDYGQLTVDALNRHTTTPEFTARYKAWLELIGPELWTPVAKANYEQILAEEAIAKAQPTD